MAALTTAEEAGNREYDAYSARYTHGKASRTWSQVAIEQPQRAEICEILARWMAAYEDADAEAEKAFRELAAQQAPR